MKTIKSLAELQKGTQIVYLEDGNAEYYDVIMPHPVQARSFVLMRKPDMKLITQHSATMMNSAAWRIDYTAEEVLDYKICYYEQMAGKLRELKRKYGCKSEETPSANDIEQAAEEFSRFATASSVVLKDICVGFKGGVEHEHNRLMSMAVGCLAYPQDQEILIDKKYLAGLEDGEEIKVIIIKEETK